MNLFLFQPPLSIHDAPMSSPEKGLVLYSF